MRVKIEEDYARIIPLENIDLTNAEKLKEKFTELVEEENIKNIILDFRNVEKIDSSGLGKLLLFHKIIKEVQGKLKIKNVNSQYVKKVFNMVNLTETLDIEM